MIIKQFDTDQNVLVIAEIGNNHEGNYSLAERMICMAAEAGAGAVKFQTIVPERLVSVMQTDRIKQLQRFRLSYDEFEKLARVAGRKKVMFLSTPFDLESVRFLQPLVPAFKIASADNTFFPLIEEIAKTGKPIILSSGLANWDEISHTKDFIFRLWKERGITRELAILHCVSCYPTPPADANLLSIRRLRAPGVTVGYSDHTQGIEAAVLSVALGARIIEKHFTLDKNYSDFRDHKLSADPGEFALLVRKVREATVLLGKSEKDMAESEIRVRSKLRRSIAAKMELVQGTRLEWKHLCWIRPGDGLSPGREGEILGKVLKRTVKQGELILPGYVATELD